MNKRWDIEVSLGKHGRNLRYVLSDRVSTGNVRRIIGGNLDGAAFREQFEVMSRFRPIKTHNFISTRRAPG